MERRVFYISRSLATPEQTEQILVGARLRNQRSGVSGALLFTGGHFAQLLEGSPQALATTMAVIEADPRHEALTRLIESDIEQRRFADWTMAYMESPGADELIEQLLASPAISTERAERILTLMLETSPR
ncbi:BLUF domain-containing protein [Roseateles violae]|uniref:BLUF domain-containing protein n=1 Tax=Roseateles violae TaxID=3058042 RepID=A0ABT8DMX7_9BURK|nr:BLUF domain-containing protein [Pelomonas sp. PFR6]MDN3919293.1 BLUF domain-containing protein [Pelomonas sp. PFR6]